MKKISIFTKRAVLLLVMVLCLSVFLRGGLSTYVSAASPADNGSGETEFAGGTGIKTDPYQIVTAEQFSLLSSKNETYKDKHFILKNDIDLTQTTWTPVTSFTGILDGSNHKITGLKIGSSDAPAAMNNKPTGLFVSVSGTIRNLTVSAEIYVSDESTYTGVGILTGNLFGLLDNCRTEGSIAVNRTNAYVGGIAGYVGGGGKIVNCCNKASVSASGSTTTDNVTRVGGIIGAYVVTSSEADNSILANTCNHGTVTATNGCQPRVGGICGWIENNSSTAKLYVYNCYNTGVVRVTGYTDTKGHISGFAGNSVGTGAREIQCTYSATECEDFTSENLKHKWPPVGSTTKPLSEMNSDSFVSQLNENVQSSQIAGLMKWTLGTDSLPVVSPVDEPDATEFTQGDGSENNPYQITNAAQMQLLSSRNAEYKDKHFVLTTDIDLSSIASWTPIAAFSGTLDGNGKTITGLKIGTASEPETALAGKTVGLFGEMSGTVKDLTVNAEIFIQDASSWPACGILVGQLSGTLDHCRTEGTISVIREQAHAGGLAGYAGGGSRIVNCCNMASVSASGSTASQNMTRAGGLIGSLVLGRAATEDAFVANSYNLGTVTATGGHTPRVGGLCGWIENNSANRISLYNSYNAGAVTISNYTGAKGTIGNVTGFQSGATDTQSLYGADSFLNITDGVASALSVNNEEQITEAEMRSESFAEMLTVHADALVGSGVCSGLLSWQAQANATPGFGSTYVAGDLLLLNISVNSSALGSVKVLADETGGSNFTKVTALAVKKGSNLKLVLQPTSGCRATSVTVGGVEKEITDNSCTFVLNEQAAISVTFELESTVDVGAIYVNPAAEAGGTGTEDNPFCRIEDAVAKLQSIVASQPNANVTVYLMDGDYVLNQPITLNAANTSLGCIVFQRYENANPVITSSHTIDAGRFVKVEGEAYYQYQLEDNEKVNGSFPEFRDLYVDGTRAILARTKDLTFKYSYDNQVLDSNKVSSCDNSLYVSQEALAAVTDDEIGTVELGQLIEWKSQIFHLGARNSANVKTGEVNVSIKQSEWDEFYTYDRTKKNLTGYTYWLQNHLSFLDEPGEFYYDQDYGVIYYYPYADQNMQTVNVGYATLDVLVDLDHASNVTFDGITFTGTTANLITRDGLGSQLGCSLYGKNGDTDCGENVPCAAILGNYAQGITIQNCSFEELGGSAVVFQYGAKNIKLIGSSMRNLAMCGIAIGVPQLTWNTAGLAGFSENVEICNNYITNIGVSVYGAPAIAVKRSENLKILYNKIVHTPYSGITAGWGFNTSSNPIANKCLVNAEIAYNHVEDTVYKINDGAAIYVNGANAAVTETSMMNSIHDNYVRAGAHNKTYTGIYHDGSASNWHTYHNFIDDMKSAAGPMFFQDNVPSQATHNILVEKNFTTVSMIVQNGSTDSNGNPRNVVIKDDNIMFADRSKINAEAAAIQKDAGLQETYKHLEKPMDVELRIDDATMHYSVNLKQDNNTSMKISLTNNSLHNRAFKLETTDKLPDGIELKINGDNTISVNAGSSVIVSAEFLIVDREKVTNTDAFVAGIRVTDETGRVTNYPRTFSVYTLSGKTDGEIPYGTPTVDGVLDEVYKDGTFYLFGEVFHPDTYHTSDITGGYYLLWDENYLYCYVIVNESTIMSRGTEWVNAQLNTPGNMWETDAVETYIRVPSVGSGASKFAVDAFGLQRFGNAGIDVSIHNVYPWESKFTCNGQIVDAELPDVVPGGKTATEILGTEVTGYVIEMTLPIKLIETIIESDDGVPSVGDTVDFFIQNNDYRGQYPDGRIYTVAQKNSNAKYVLTKNNVTVQYNVTFTGDGGDDTAALSGNAETAVSGTDYCFSLPADSNAYAYSLSGIFINGEKYTGYTKDGLVVTIPGEAITGEIVITISKIEKPQDGGTGGTGSKPIPTKPSESKPRNEFDDVLSGSYYRDAVNWAVENGITYGTSNNTFDPDGICTRAQAVTFLWRAAGKPTPKGNAAGFSDVVSGSYYEQAVLWAVENGITLGTSKTTFGPDERCTRAQIASFIFRFKQAERENAANANGIKLPFTDVPEWAYESIAWCYQSGITNGMTKELFGSNNPCTRAQIVTFLWRAFTK